MMMMLMVMMMMKLYCTVTLDVKLLVNQTNIT